MWVFFGFITLISFTIYFWYKHINAGWKGHAQSTKEYDYQYKIEWGEEKHVAKLLIGIDAPQGYDYTLKKESGFDRLVKTLGIVKEHQTGNIRFDDFVYIVSDNTQFHRQLLPDGTIVNAFIKIFQFGRSFHCTVQDVRHNSGRLWITILPKEGFSDKRISALASKIVPELYNVANELKRIPLTASNSWKDPFTAKAAILLAISSAMAVNGGLQLFRYINLSNTITLDRHALLNDALMLGFLTSGVLALIAIYVLKRSSRTHLVLVELLLLGSFGAIVTAYAELNDINITADTSAGVHYESVVFQKRYQTQRRAATKYFLNVRDWNSPDALKKIELRVPEQLYHDVAVGDRLSLLQKDGYFKYRWIDELKRSD